MRSRISQKIILKENVINEDRVQVMLYLDLTGDSIRNKIQASKIMKSNAEIEKKTEAKCQLH